MKTPIVVIQTGPRLNDKELESVFAVGSEMRWYRAVVQILEDHRQERLDQANAFMAENSSLGLAGCHGGAGIITTVLADMESKRIGALRKAGV